MEPEEGWRLLEVTWQIKPKQRKEYLGSSASCSVG